MQATVYIKRDQWGRAILVSTRRDSSSGWKWRKVGTTKQLVLAMLQLGSSKTLLDTAWRMAVCDGQVEPSRPFRYGEAFDALTITWAKGEAAVLDSYLSELVNNPKSKFYIYG